MSEPATKKLISVVIPAYNEEGNIEELGRRLQGVFQKNPKYDFEAIIVENGSHDSTFEKLKELHEKDKRFKIVLLSRNFKCDGGITAGLQHASGDAAVVMTADLQDPPELITTFIQKWEEGYENVYGVITKRHGSSLLRRFNSQLFYILVNKLTGGLFPRNASDFRLVDKRVYRAVNSMWERNRFLRGMFIWTGFKSIGVEHERAPRFAGEAKSHTLVVLRLAVMGILSYSYVPLKAITAVGVFVSTLSFLILVFIVIRVFAWGVPFPGFGTIMAVMLLMFGFLFTMLGIMSEYIGLIYEEVKQRPNFIVKEAVGFDNLKKS
ncbi:MAG TPA: glycosyltransferase family 2 protein [Elusimicrobiota bacterium]|nr:glycosyltransferase family 2 protein [Elusimicrobiota bacterium]